MAGALSIDGHSGATIAYTTADPTSLSADHPHANTVTLVQSDNAAVGGDNFSEDVHLENQHPNSAQVLLHFSNEDHLCGVVEGIVGGDEGDEPTTELNLPHSDVGPELLTKRDDSEEVAHVPVEEEPTLDDELGEDPDQLIGHEVEEEATNNFNDSFAEDDIHAAIDGGNDAEPLSEESMDTGSAPAVVVKQPADSP